MPWFGSTILILFIQVFKFSKCSVIPDHSRYGVQLSFELGKRCTYSYQVAVNTARGSHSTASQGHEIHTLVDVTPVNQDTGESSLHTIRLDVYQPRIRRLRGERVLVNHPVNEDLEQKLSKPFYFRQHWHGTVQDALFPKYDDPQVIALKKGIAGAFQVHLKSVGSKAQHQVEEHDDSGIYLTRYTTLQSNDSHATVKREWTNKDYLVLSDGTPSRGEHKVQSQHTGVVQVKEGQIRKVHRKHNGVFESEKGHPRAENKKEYQENEQDIRVSTSGYSKLTLVGCHHAPSKAGHHRSKREAKSDEHIKQDLKGLHRDSLVFKDAHKINWKDVGGDKITFRPFYDLMRCFTDPTVKNREIGECAREIHKLAEHNNEVFEQICKLVRERTHQNVTSWSVLVSVLAGNGKYQAQNILANALMSEYPQKLTQEEYETLLEGIFYIPKGPIHKRLFNALLLHAKRHSNHGHNTPMAMLVLAGLTKRAETAGYNSSLSDVVVEVIHESYRNKSNIYEPESEEHESFLRSHIWAFGNVGHPSGLKTMLKHANHDSSGIRAAVVSGMRKLSREDTNNFLANTLYKDESNDVKAAVMDVYIERHDDLSDDIVQALEHAMWNAEDGDALDDSVQTFLENHNNHPKTKHLRKRRHVLRRQKRALIPALRPREIQLGPNKRWGKNFGGKYLGAESQIQFRNQVKLRIGIFGGKFEVDLDNYAKIDAHILKWGFDIVKGKAAFKASASFKNDIPKDLIHAIADAGDDIFAKIDGITNIIAEHIQKFKDKLKNLVPLNIQKLIDFVNKIVKFVENLLKPLKPINIMKKILTLAKKIVERLKNWEWLMNNIRKIQISLNKLNIVDDVFKKVISALGKIMSIINSIKVRLPHGLPPNFKIEDLLKWLKSVSVDLQDIKIKEFFKSLGLNFVPKGFNLQLPFRFSIHFSFSMDKFIEVCMKVIKFANNILDFSSLMDALESIRLPRLNLPRLEGKFPVDKVKWFNFGLSFDWRINLKFDLDLKGANFVKFLNVLGRLGDFLKRFKLPSFDLQEFFNDIMPDKTLDLSKIIKELFGENGNSTAIGRNPADILKDFFDKVLNILDINMSNITAISDVTDFFKELGPAMKEFAEKSASKLCKIYKVALNSSRDFKSFGENIEKQGIEILKKVNTTTQSALQELVNYTVMIDRLIDDIEKNFTLATRGFVSKSLKELSQSLKQIQSLADQVVEFANGTASKANGVCVKAANISVNIIDDVQSVSRQALSELTGFIGPVAQKVKGIGQELKTAVNNVEGWYKENMEVRVGKISKIARLVSDFMSILNTKKGFLGKVREIANKVNEVLTHMRNIPSYAQKARETADDIIKFADRAQAFKDNISKLDLRKEFKIDYDKKVREFCDKFKKMASETLNKIGDYDIVEEVNGFFTDEAEKLITKAGSKLRRIKQPIEDIRVDLKEISSMVEQVMVVLINLKPFNTHFSPILATANRLPDCQEAIKIFTESTKPCVQKAMVVGKYAIDQYKDMRKEVKVLYDMIPETWKSLKIQKCIKGGACISKSFIDQAKVIQEKVEALKTTYEEASGYTDMLKVCRAGVDNITQVIDTAKLLIQQIKDFNLNDDMRKIKDMLRSVTGRNIAEGQNGPSRRKRDVKDVKDRIKRVIDYVRKAKETKEKLEEILQNAFKAMKSVYDDAIFDHIKKIEDVSKKVNMSYKLWKKTKDINAIIQGLDNIIKESSDYAKKLNGITNAFSSPVVKLLTETGELSDVVKPHMTKYINKVKEATDKVNGFFDKVTEFQNKIQLRQKGLDLSQYKKWSEYPYCSEDVCLRPLRRSSSLYYSTIFTWKFPHLDDLSSMKDSGRWLTPGLFDNYKVEGITQISKSEMLLGMHGVSENKGKASILVVTDVGRNTVKKIIQLGSPQNPFTAEISGVSIAKNNIWISNGQSNNIYRISKGSVTGSFSTAVPSWVGISKSYSVEGIASSVSFDEQKTMLWVTDGRNGKGYGYRLSPTGDLLTSQVAPDRVLTIGKDAQGMAIVRQFNTEYVVVSRCAMRAGFQCKLEFHDLTDGNEVSENSLSRVVRTPSGLESVEKVRNDLLAIAFSSGTYSEKDVIESIGGDFEDRYFRMKLPILKMTFGITENCLMFKVMGEWIITPRRLFPFGDLRCGALRKRSIQNELLESDVYSQELEEVHSRNKRSSGEMPSCMTLFRGNVKRGYHQFMPDWQQVIIVFGIPVKLFAGAGGYWFVDYHGKLCMRDRTFKVGLIPGAWISVHAGASIQIFIVEAGITIEAILLETYLLPELTVKIDKWPLKACIELKMRMTPLKIRVWLWYRFRLCIRIRCKCFSCSIRIRWCSKKTFAEWWWSARQIERTLFSTCKQDVDTTPPVAGTCSARQVGDKKYFVQWHGFKEDTKINFYWVKIGSIQGSGDDYGKNVGTSLSALVNNLEIMNGRNVYASVRATNDGGLDSRLALCPVFKAKRTAPQIRYVYDGSTINIDKDFQSDNYGMAVNFAWAVSGQNIIDVKWGISTTSSCTFNEKEVDVYGLASVGETTLIQTSGLSLIHGQKYYTRIVATNSIGLKTIMCSDGIVIDTTVPKAGYLFDGAGEKDAEFLPSTKRVRARYEPFTDNESPMTKYEWKIVYYSDSSPIDITNFVDIPLSQQAPLMENLDLRLGQKYHIILLGTNAAGLQTTKISDGFVADNTAPSCSPVLDVLSVNDNLDVDFVRQLKSIQVKWKCDDKESGVINQFVAVGTYPGGEDIKTFKSINNLTNFNNLKIVDGGIYVKLTDIDIEPKVRYHVTIKAFNGAGIRRTVSSDGILIDTTPPSVASQYIKDGLEGKDTNYTKERFGFSVHWDQAFVDAESGLATYRVGLGTKPGLVDVKKLTSVGKETKTTLTGLILDSGQKYFVTVVGCNGVGMCVNGSSNGAVVDFVPPHPGSVVTGYKGPPVLFQWITKSVWARWDWCPADERRDSINTCSSKSFYDIHSGIDSFGLSVTSLASEDFLASFSKVGKVRMSGRSIDLKDGVYSVAVRAKDKAGMTSIGYSNTFIVDSSPPVIINLQHGRRGESMRYTKLSEYKFEGYFEIEDDLSRVLGYRVIVGSYSGGDDISSSENVILSHPSSTVAVNWTAERTSKLENNRKYFLTVLALNGAGLFGSKSSEALTSDSEPPKNAIVLDGWGMEDVKYQSYSSIYRAHWYGLSDFSGIHSIYLGIKSNPVRQDCDISPYELVPNNANYHVLYGLNLKSGSKYYACLKVIDNAQNVAYFSSNGVIIDSTPPIPGKVTDGKSGVDTNVQIENSILWASWTNFTEQETQIVHYNLAFGSLPGKEDIQEFTNVGLVQNAGSTRLKISKLTSGQVYYATVTAVNNIGMQSLAVSSDGVMVDSTPPKFSIRVSHGPGTGVIQKYTSINSLSVYWLCFDNETQLQSVRIGLGLQPGASDIMNYTNVPVKQMKYVLKTSLQLGMRYFATVKCENKVGLKSFSSSDGIVYDNTPSRGLYIDDGDYQNSTMVLDLKWNFYDIQSGIKKYMVFVQNSDKSKHQGPFYFRGTIHSASILLKLPLEVGKKYFSNVTSLNGVGMASSLLSDGFVVDNTPPTCYKVWHGDKEEHHYIGLTNTLVVSWNCSDEESHITNFRFAVQDMTSKEFVLPFHSKKETLNSTGSVSVTGNGLWLPKYQQGKKYRVAIEITNAVKLKSIYWTSGVLVDNTPPTVNKFKLVFNPKSDSLFATWDLKDQQSGIASLKWGLGSRPDKIDLVNLQSIDEKLSSLSLTKSQVQVRQGKTYFMFLVAMNLAGLSGKAVSNGAVIDRSPPKAGVVTAQYVLPLNYDRNKNVVPGSSFMVSWTGFIDEESGIAQYSWSVGNKIEVSNSDDSYYTVIPIDEANGGVQISNFTLVGNTTYYVCIRAINGAGLKRTDCSEKMKVILGKFSAGKVNDGPRKSQIDLDFQLDDRAIWAFWDGFKDPVFGVSAYEWCIGDHQPTPSENDVCKWSYMKVSHLRKYAHRFFNITLLHGTTYYATVKAYNSRGENVRATSDGVLVDRSPPSGSLIEVSPSSGKDTLYINSLSPPKVTWKMEDKESGLNHFKIGIGSYQFQDDLLKFTKISSLSRSTGFDDMNFTISHGALFSVTIVGSNMLELETSLSTQQIVVDLTPPSSGTVFDGNNTDPNIASNDIDYQITKEVLSANWNGFEDIESGVVEYKWCIGLKQGTCDVKTMVSTGLQTSATAYIKLQEGVRYFTNVEAINAAGLKILSSSDGITLDSSPPTIGDISFVKPSEETVLVSDGNITIQSSGKKLTVQWKKAKDAQSGIHNLKYCVGKLQGTCDIVEWTELNIDASSVSHTFKTQLPTGTMIYVSLQVQNGAGLTVMQKSNALLVDSTPPVGGSVSVGNVPGIKYLQKDEAIEADWGGFNDQESTLDHYEWAICQAINRRSCVTKFINVGLTTKLKNGELEIKQGISYLMIIRAYNKVGLHSSVASNVFIASDNQPIPGDVFDGSEISKDISLQTSADSISANWEPFRDSNSRIANYELCLGSKPSFCDINPYQSVGMVYMGEIAGLNLRHMQTYYTTVRATNEAGYKATASTNGVKIDKTPPIGGSVRDGKGADDIDFQAQGSFISANWDKFEDDETDIYQYKWCVGTAKGSCDVVPERAITDGNTKVQMQVYPSIVSGVTVYVKVTAVNGAGGMTTVYSDGVQIDSSPPQLTNVKDQETNGSLVDVDFITSKTKYCASWNSADLESGVIYNEVSVCTEIDNTNCLITSVNVGNRSLVCMSNLDIKEGVKYVTIVRATNNVGLSTILSSDGFILDFTPPISGKIEITGNSSSTFEDGSSLYASSVIVARWKGFWDKETSILRYFVCLGTRSGSCGAVNLTDIGQRTEYRFQNTIKHATRYYVSVVAENEAGLKSILTTSDGIYTDKTAPIVGSAIYDGSKDGVDKDFQVSNTEISAHWNSFEDPDSGVLEYKYCIGTTAGLCDILPRKSMSKWYRKFDEVLPRPMKNGLRFFVTVQGSNGAGLASVLISDGVTVDITPPVPGKVIDGNASRDIDYLVGDNDVFVKWFNFKDDESGIKKYEVAICDAQNLTDCPQQFTDVNNASSIKITGLDLKSGTLYIAKVKAINHAGLQTEANSNGFTVDFTAPIKSSSWIGPGMHHMQYQADNRTLQVRWMPFTDSESEISKYELCVQLTSSSSDCSAYTDVGQNTHYVLSGLNLNHGKSYHVIIRATNGAGLTAKTRTKHTMIDTTPPKVTSIILSQNASISSSPRPSIRFSCTEELLSADWDECEDRESMVSKYEWCVGTASKRCDITTKKSANLKLRGQQIVNKIASGTGLFATVFVSNKAGLKTVLYSRKCLVITVAPNVYKMFELEFPNSTNNYDVDWTSNMKSLSYKWNVLGKFMNDISRISAEVAITQTSSNKTYPRLNEHQSWNGEPFVQSFMPVSPAQRNVTIESVPLEPWQGYRGIVRVWNQGGLYSEKSSDSIRIEPSPPWPRKVMLRDRAPDEEKARWLPDLHLPSFNLSGLDPDVKYISSPGDISVAVSDMINATNSSVEKLNQILDTGAFSPTEEFKLVINKITSDSNETNTTEHSFETKTLPGFADPSGPCCTNHTPHWLVMQSDIHYKPTTVAKHFGSSIVLLSHHFVAVSSSKKVFFFSKKNRLLNSQTINEISPREQRKITGISYSQNRLGVASDGKISIYHISFTPSGALKNRLEASISNCKVSKCNKYDVVWSDLTASSVVLSNSVLATTGKISPANVSVVGIFQKNSSVWTLKKVLGESNKDLMFGNSLAFNDQLLAISSGTSVIIYSTVDYSIIKKIDLRSYKSIIDPSLQLTKANTLVLVSRSTGKAIIIQLDTASNTFKTVCSYSVASDVRLSGKFDLMDSDDGKIVVLGMQTQRGRDGVILTGFYGSFAYHPYHEKGKCIGLGRIIAREEIPRVDDGTPRASVSAKGSTILFGTPGVLTWPSSSENHGTGRVYSTTFCPRNYKRTKVSNTESQQTFQCEPCESGRKSLGGITRICAICENRKCASYFDDDPVHFVTEICDRSQCPLLKQFNNKTNSIKVNQMKDTFFEEGAVNEYSVKLVEITRSGMSTTSKSEPFIIDTTSPEVGTVYDGLGSNPDKNCSNNETFGEDSQCSTRDFQDTDIDYTNITSEVHARWVDFKDNESDIAEYFWCIGSKPMLDDIRECESTGQRQNASAYAFDFKQGDTYYVTVVACNGAQRCSAAHSNGVTIDTTPPIMQYVRDGVLGPDIDFQVFVDIIFAYFKASDPDSGVTSYEVAWGTAPGMVDTKDFEEIGNTTTWFAKFKDNALKKKTRYYATVRAVNKAGLISAPLSSNGVLVGKSEYIFDNNASASFFFDTVNMNPDGSRKDGGVGKTYGTLDVPKGAVDSEVKLTCYSLDKKTLESNKSDEGPVSNPEVTKPKNFMLGNYSFQIKASDPINNTIQEGYKFAKPIKISMFYDVDNLVRANKRVVNKDVTKKDIDPVLYLWNLKNKTWMDASLTCPKPWSHINRTIKLLTVQICHLTQFAFYWSFKAQKGLMMFDKNASVYDNNGDINIVRQSSVQEIDLPVKRSKGSTGNIVVHWSLYSNQSHHRELIWPNSGKIFFQEGQWNGSISLTVASDERKTDERTILVRLDNITGGALLAPHELTTAKFVITSNLTLEPSNSRTWIIVGVCCGLLVILIIIIIIIAAVRHKRGKEKIQNKSYQSTSLKYKVNEKDKEDSAELEMTEAANSHHLLISTDNVQDSFDEESKKDDSSDVEGPHEKPSSKISNVFSLKRSPKVSGIANPSSFDTASNVSTSDDEQLEEVPRKPTKRLSLKKKDKPRDHRFFENPGYGSDFEMKEQNDLPIINIEKIDAHNVENASHEKTSPVSKPKKKSSINRHKAWESKTNEKKENLVPSIDIKRQEDILLNDFGDSEPEGESSTVNSHYLGPSMNGSFSASLPGSSDEGDN